MYTVAEVLSHPLMENAHIVAGHLGLNRLIAWVHNAGTPDAPEWLNGGELVLTTIINMPTERDEQVDYVRQMADKGVAALAISTGRYIDAIPDYLCAIADETDFPLIEISYQARFVDIAKALNQRISQESMERVAQALSIQQTLTRLVLEGGSYQDLADKLADLLEHSISIETERFEAIATRNIAEVDEARRYTQIHGRTDPRLVQALRDRGYLPQIEQTLRPRHLPEMPDVGLEMERVLAPIVVHGSIYGYMWIIADDHSISEIDMMAIEIGATIAALMMLYQESVQSAEASVKGSLLSQLIQGDDTRDTVLTGQSLHYGVDLRAPFLMMLIELHQPNSGQQTRLYRIVNQWVAQTQWQAVVGQFAGQIVILTAQAEDVVKQAEAILAYLRSHNHDLDKVRIAISGVHQGAIQVQRAYQQCQDVLKIKRRLLPNQPIVQFSNLGYLHALYQAGPASLEDNPQVPIVRRLLDPKSADLFATLEAYLDAGGNGVSTAESLHIHRSTLNYRLSRIEQLCEVSLQDPQTRTNLQIALKLLRLFDQQAAS
ncbi:MAG: hypothetical protein CL607_27150 [Anaerolineaceae bacterium]|nr:hypothetical protein [Anaerolineaceae bacterium]